VRFVFFHRAAYGGQQRVTGKLPPFVYTRVRKRDVREENRCQLFIKIRARSSPTLPVVLSVLLSRNSPIVTFKYCRRPLARSPSADWISRTEPPPPTARRNSVNWFTIGAREYAERNVHWFIVVVVRISSGFGSLPRSLADLHLNVRRFVAVAAAAAAELSKTKE